MKRPIPTSRAWPMRKAPGWCIGRTSCNHEPVSDVPDRFVRPAQTTLTWFLASGDGCRSSSLPKGEVRWCTPAPPWRGETDGEMSAPATDIHCSPLV